MRLLFDIAALLAAIVLGYLFYLLLFERGAFYRVSGAVHELNDHQRLRSFGLNDEVDLVACSEALWTQLDHSFEQDLGNSDALDLASWHRRAWSERLLATLGRIIERHQ